MPFDEITWPTRKKKSKVTCVFADTGAAIEQRTAAAAMLAFDVSVDGRGGHVQVRRPVRDALREADGQTPGGQGQAQQAPDPVRKDPLRSLGRPCKSGNPDEK